MSLPSDLRAEAPPAFMNNIQPKKGKGGVGQVSVECTKEESMSPGPSLSQGQDMLEGGEGNGVVGADTLSPDSLLSTMYFSRPKDLERLGQG